MEKGKLDKCENILHTLANTVASLRQFSRPSLVGPSRASTFKSNSTTQGLQGISY